MTRVAIALGANLGDRLGTLQAAVDELAGRLEVVAVSAVYETDPVGGPDGQPAFLNGVPNVNKMSDTLFEAVRLNTAVGPTLTGQNPLGAATCFDPPASNAVGPTLNLARVGCDPAGFPNGRRPGDDTVDIALRVAMGFLLDQNHAPIRGAPLVDGAAVSQADFVNAFPYLKSPTVVP